MVPFSSPADVYKKRRRSHALGCQRRIQYFVIKQSFYDTWARIEAEVDADIALAPDAPLVVDVPSQDIQPAIPPEPPIPKADRDAAEFYFSDRLPEHNPESSRPPSWMRQPFDPFGGR